MSGVKHELQKGGFPDCGSGRYTMRAGYRAWYQFNNAQRVHIHWVENATQMFALQLIMGLYWPMPTAIVGGIYLLGRIFYTMGYARGGPKSRSLGAAIILPIQFFMPFFTIAATFYLASDL